MDQIIFGVWLLLSLAVGAAAASRGRSFVAWSALSFLTSLVIGILVAVAVPDPMVFVRPEPKATMLTIAWYVVSFLMPPLIAVLALVVMPNLKAMELEERRHKETLAAIRGDQSSPEDIADFVARAKAGKRRAT